MNTYNRTKTTVSQLNYHFVFCPRYRRKIFLNDDIDRRFKDLVTSVCDTHQFEILALETHLDHCHLFVSALPKYSPADIMNKIKGGTSKILRDEFPELSAAPSLWTRSYFVSTAGQVSSETIQEYVETQHTRGGQ